MASVQGVFGGFIRIAVVFVEAEGVRGSCIHWGRVGACLQRLQDEDFHSWRRGASKRDEEWQPTGGSNAERR
jgi:hypothetical protein